MALQKQARKLTKDLLMEPNLKHPLKKMGKNDQRVGAQADRPAILHKCQSKCPQEKSDRIFIIIDK